MDSSSPVSSGLPVGGAGLGPSLGAQLFREVPPGFFRVLSGANASAYTDVLDALERECSERNEGIGREEALAIIAEVLGRYPGFQPEEPDPAAPLSVATDTEAMPLRDKARYVLETLARAGWVVADTSADWRRSIFFDSHGSTLLEAMRRVARPDSAVFTDKLVGVCAALSNDVELARQPWEHIQACRDNVRLGISELRAMQKGVERFIKRQLDAGNLRENLNIVFDQYAEQIGHTCYAELIRSQLANRLGDARMRVEGLLDNMDLLHKMQAEAMRRDPAADAAGAMTRVRRQLEDLGQALESVLPLADAIDARTAEFTRRSLARFRYLQEVVGERRAQMKGLFEKLNQAFAGRRFQNLDEAQGLPVPLLPETRLLAGHDSLYHPPKRRSIEQNAPLEDDLTDAQRDRTLRQMDNALRDSLTVNRANLLVERLPGGKGTRVSSAELELRNEDDLADVIALLLHAQSAEARYRIESPGLDDPAGVERDTRMACRIDRFEIIKK